MLKFRRNQTLDPPKIKTNYPSGLCVHTESGWFFIKNNKRLRISSRRVLESWNFNISESTDLAVKHMPIIGKLGFRDGTLIRNIADNKIYLISGNKRLHINNPDVFNRYGLNRNNILEVSNSETNLHDEGEILD